MIVFLRGEVAATRQSAVDLDVSGVGYRVYVPDHITASLQSGERVMLYTHHHIREDAQVLYGFADELHLEWFELLISVSGIGPKSALALVSASTYEDFLTAIAMEDAAYLCTMPGIGKKTAARLLVELKDKVPEHTLSSVPGRTNKGPVRELRSTRQPSLQGDLVEALTSLGYNERQASEVVLAVVPEDAEMPLELALTKCLQQLDSSRRGSI